MSNCLKAIVGAIAILMLCFSAAAGKRFHLEPLLHAAILDQLIETGGRSVPSLLDPQANYQDKIFLFSTSKFRLREGDWLECDDLELLSRNDSKALEVSGNNRTYKLWEIVQWETFASPVQIFGSDAILSENDDHTYRYSIAVQGDSFDHHSIVGTEGENLKSYISKKRDYKRRFGGYVDITLEAEIGIVDFRSCDLAKVLDIELKVLGI